MHDDRLFAEESLDGVTELLQRQLQEEVEEQDPDYLLQVSENDLVEHLVSKFSLSVPTLDPERAEISDSREVQFNAGRFSDPGQDWGTPGPHFVQGQRIVISVPFTGDAKIFRYRTNPWKSSLPTGLKVAPGTLQLIYEGTNLDGSEIAAGWRGRLSAVEEWLGFARAQVERHNNALEPLARKTIEARREKILRDRNAVESIVLPIRKREGEPMTYTIPAPQRKEIIPKPAATREPFKPEPGLDDQIFEDILDVIRHMAMVMERSPKAFAGMGEEDLRQHFLVHLNGAFQGAATAETFNYDGKTDILIRESGKNVFIGECKIWKGPDTLTKTIDQILGYLAWRDTKAAVLMFVRNKNFTAVLDQIDALVEQHPNYKKTVERASETEFRFVLGQRDDPNREIALAVLLFPVPSV